MSTIMDETNTFLARDGLYYATYQEMRNANVRDNEKRLKALGLDKKLVPVQKRKLGSNHISSSSSSSSNNNNNNKRNKTGDSNTTNPVRRSNRVRRVTPEIPLGLDEDPFEPSRATKKSKVRRSSTSNNVGTGTSVVTAAESSSSSRSLSEEDRNKLKNLPDWVNDMEIYLRDEENLSRQNVSSVMRQVAKLATGVGISYSRWDDNVIFAKDRSIDLSDDLDTLYVEAIDFEDEHGRDLGNGTSSLLNVSHCYIG
jgi:hypothetical protein